MQTTQTLQFDVAEGLDTKAESIDPGGPESGECLRRHAFRLGFEGDLSVGGERERPAACGNEGADLLRLEQRRRATAKEESVGRRAASERFGMAGQLNLLQRRRHIFGFQRVIE